MTDGDTLGDRIRRLTRAERGVAVFVVGLVGVLLAGTLGGVFGPTYVLYLLGLVGMYVLLSFGLNVQWGYAGLINFSVAAFFGLGAYGTALLTADNSPIAGGVSPVVGLVVGLALAAVLAVAIGIPTLRLRTDYLAIASLGLAEVVRLVVRNERQWTNGSAGLRGIPGFFEGWPVLAQLPETLPGLRVEVVPGSPIFVQTPFWQAALNVGLVFVFVAVTYLLLRRLHRSPWGRVLRTIRSDEDLAAALGRDTYRFKMQAFVLGSVIAALAGVFYAHLNLFVSPGDLEPINTFYVWIAVILGGSGSNRGAMFGGFVVIAIREGTRFVDSFGGLPVDVAPLRLLVIGLLIVLVMRFRPEGVLPPQRELIWPAALADAETPERGPDTAADGGDES